MGAQRLWGTRRSNSARGGAVYRNPAARDIRGLVVFQGVGIRNEQAVTSAEVIGCTCSHPNLQQRESRINDPVGRPIAVRPRAKARFEDGTCVAPGLFAWRWIRGMAG